MTDQHRSTDDHRYDADGYRLDTDAELQRRLWRLFDVAKAICETETPAAWIDLYRAVADVPESQRP